MTKWIAGGVVVLSALQFSLGVSAAGHRNIDLLRSTGAIVTPSPTKPPLKKCASCVECSSCFFLATKNYVYLITARHALFANEGQSTSLFSRETIVHIPSNGETNKTTVQIHLDLDGLMNAQKIRRHATKDVAAIQFERRFALANISFGLDPFAKVVAGSQQMNAVVFTDDDVCRFADIPFGAEARLAGFPVAVIPDITYTVVVPGIISTKRDMDADLLVSVRSYGGFSGGPVFVDASADGTIRTAGGNWKVAGVQSALYIGNIKGLRDNSGLSQVVSIDHVLGLLEK